MDDYTPGNYLHHQSYYKTYFHSFNKTKKLSVPQQIYFAGKLGEDVGATILFIAEQQQKTILNFFLDSLIATE